MRKIELTEGLVNGLLSYLSKQPYAEVRQLFDAVHAEMRNNKLEAVQDEPQDEPAPKAAKRTKPQQKVRAVNKK